MVLEFTRPRIRQILLIKDVEVLSDAEIEFHMDITREEANTSDALAMLYHTCWKLAASLSWDKVKSANGVTWEAPKPEKFKGLYDDRLNQLGLGSKPKKVNWEKVDTQQY